MGLKATLLEAKVFHKRLAPKINSFTYGIYYYCLPLSQLENLPVPVNRPGLVSFYTKDHGYRDNRPLLDWGQDQLKNYGIDLEGGEIVLVAMPRILGFVFNPVSFWLCFDQQTNLRAVICEVNNTFGETHSYLCAHDDGAVIRGNESLSAQKLFHVSPFIKRDGQYKFRFDIRNDKMAIWIDFHDESGNKHLLTSLTGSQIPLTQTSINQAFWQHPLVTFKAVFLIHWQAFKLIAKGIKHITKPPQRTERISRNLTDN